MALYYNSLEQVRALQQGSSWLLYILDGHFGQVSDFFLISISISV